MKDFPFFTTQNGAASLILKEIPYRKEAYIKILSSQDPGELLQECISFCRICGAEKIYASGDSCIEQYPVHTSVLRMRGEIALEENEIASMFPVTEQTVGKWRSLYNQKMTHVDNASTLEAKDEPRILESGGAYFIHNSGNLIGIGWLEENRIAAVASFIPGGGESVVKALQSIQPQQQLELEVASTNEKAIRLYQHLGFIATEEISKWHRVL